MGDWKSKALLFCDDQFKSGETIRREKWHTSVQTKYNNLKNNLSINLTFGPITKDINHIGWCHSAVFTEKLIQIQIKIWYY